MASLIVSPAGDPGTSAQLQEYLASLSACVAAKDANNNSSNLTPLQTAWLVDAYRLSQQQLLLAQQQAAAAAVAGAALPAARSSFGQQKASPLPPAAAAHFPPQGFTTANTQRSSNLFNVVQQQQQLEAHLAALATPQVARFSRAELLAAQQTRVMPPPPAYPPAPAYSKPTWQQQQALQKQAAAPAAPPAARFDTRRPQGTRPHGRQANGPHRPSAPSQPAPPQHARGAPAQGVLGAVSQQQWSAATWGGLNPTSGPQHHHNTPHQSNRVDSVHGRAPYSHRAGHHTKAHSNHIVPRLGTGVFVPMSGGSSGTTSPASSPKAASTSSSKSSTGEVDVLDLLPDEWEY